MPNIKSEVESQDVSAQNQIEDLKKQLDTSKQTIDNLTIRCDKLAKLYIELLNKYLQGE